MLQNLQGDPQVFLVLFLRVGVDQDVINEHNDELVSIILEHSVHHVHESY